jgi:phospholipid transport system substrate-binding protein
MKLEKILLTLTILTFGLGFSPGIQAAVKGAKQESQSGSGVLQSTGQVNAPKGTPTWEIQEIERKLEEYDTSPNISAAQKTKNRKLKRDILNGAFDLRELSRQALDKHWNNISAAERSSFVALMTSLLETKAIFSKEQSKTKGKSYRISYKGDQYFDNKRRAKTLTEIYIPKENVRIDIVYQLKNDGSKWKVFDIVVDNASLVENYRYQFNNIITKHGYPELVSRMRKKLNEINTSS